MFDWLRKIKENYEENELNFELAKYFAYNNYTPPPPVNDSEDKHKLFEFQRRLEIDKQQGLSYINKTAFEMGAISGEEYLKEEKRIMGEAVNKIKELLDKELKEMEKWTITIK